MSRIGSSAPPASAAVERSSLPPAADQVGEFRGHQVKVGDAPLSAKRIKKAEKQVYSHALAQRGAYMSQKQNRLASESAQGSVDKESLTKSVKDAYDNIKQQGNQLTNFKRFRALKPDVGRVSHEKVAAKTAAQARPARGSFSDLSPADQKTFKTGAHLASISYKGVGMAPTNYELPEGHAILEDQSLPPDLTMFYDDRTGILHTPGEAKALLVQDTQAVKVIFAGTEQGDKAVSGRGGTILTDAGQRVGSFSKMYRDAAGIGRMILDHEPLKDKKVVFMGHSLGGGLAQFALGANVRRDQERLSALTFNTAGLSESTLAALGQDNIMSAHPRVKNMRIQGDAVSPGSDIGEKVKGFALGKMFTLARSDAWPVSAKSHASKTLLAQLDKAVP